MKRRKQARTSPPGQEFLRALASGRESEPPPDPVPSGGSGLERRLLETERRAATAEAALQQIRSEAERRLADARVAIGRERNARLAAERELGVHPEPPADPQPAVEAAPPPAPVEEPPAAVDEPPASVEQPAHEAEEPDVAQEAAPEADRAAESEPAEEPRPAPDAEPSPPAHRPRPRPRVAEDERNGTWPTPWLSRRQSR